MPRASSPAGVCPRKRSYGCRGTRPICFPSPPRRPDRRRGFRTIGHLHLACTPQRVETVTREAIFAKGPRRADRDGRPRGGAAPMAHHRGPGHHRGRLGARRGSRQPIGRRDSLRRRRSHGRHHYHRWRSGHRLHASQRPCPRYRDGPGGDRDRDCRRRGRHVRPSTRRTHGRIAAASSCRALLPADRRARVGRYRRRCVEDPDSYGYYREEGGGMLVGLFEPEVPPPGRSTVSRMTSASRCCRQTGSARASSWPRRWTASRCLVPPASASSSADPRASRRTTVPLLGEVPELRGF